MKDGYWKDMGFYWAWVGGSMGYCHTPTVKASFGKNQSGLLLHTEYRQIAGAVLRMFGRMCPKSKFTIDQKYLAAEYDLKFGKRFIDIGVTEPYKEGMDAAMNGVACLKNPYSPESSRPDFDKWFAGWCLGMQLKARSQ